MLNILEQVARSSSIATIISIAAVSIAILIAASYLYLNKSRTSQSSVSTKGQQAKAMKATFENAETRNDLVENPKSSLVTVLRSILYMILAADFLLRQQWKSHRYADLNSTNSLFSSVRSGYIP